MGFLPSVGFGGQPSVGGVDWLRATHSVTATGDVFPYTPGP